jgi:hypothetical protein
VGSFAGFSVVLAFDIEALDVVLELDLTCLIVPELNRGSEIALLFKMKMSLTFF